MAAVLGIAACGTKTYDLKVIVPSARFAVLGEEVRLGRTQIGKVVSIVSRPFKVQCQHCAQLTLAVDRPASSFPIDTSAKLCPAPSAGAGYLQLVLGHSAIMLPDSGTLPLSQTSAPLAC